MRGMKGLTAAAGGLLATGGLVSDPVTLTLKPEQSLGLPSLPSGAYIALVRTDGATASVSFIK